MQHDDVSSRLGDLFLPDQVGVGVRDGAVAVALAVRALAGERGQDGQWATLKIDFEIAFNNF